MIHPRPIATRVTRALLVLTAVSLAACSSSTGGGATAPLVQLPPASLAVVVPSSAPTSEPTTSTTPSEAPAESPDATPVPTTIDPCQVVTPEEASTLAGVKFGPQSSTLTSNNAKLCSYGQQGLTLNVIVAAAPDAATAKAEEPAFKAEIEKAAADAGLADLKLTEITDFQPGVDAAVLSGSTTINGTKIEGVALYALKNAVLLAITDLAYGGKAPTAQAVEDEAKVALDRLP
jgi:Protein of unknown function (DUF3558)